MFLDRLFIDERIFIMSFGKYVLLNLVICFVIGLATGCISGAVIGFMVLTGFDFVRGLYRS